MRDLSIKTEKQHKFKADRIKITLTLAFETVSNSKEAIIDNGVKQVDRILDIIRNNKDAYWTQLKAEPYRLNPQYEVSETRELLTKKTKRNIVGYTFCCEISFDALYDENLAKLYKQLLFIENVELRYEFYASDSLYEKEREVLLRELTRESQKEAEIIASGFGYKINGICNISKGTLVVNMHASKQANIGARMFANDADMATLDGLAESSSMELSEPPDIRIVDSITVSYDLEKKENTLE